MVRCVLGPVGLVLLGGGVSEGDLVVVVEPLLIVGAPAGVEDPLAKPLAHARQVLLVLLGEQNRPLEKVQILQGQGRPRYLLRTVTVPGDAPLSCAAHHRPFLSVPSPQLWAICQES